MRHHQPRSTLFPYTTLFRSCRTDLQPCRITARAHHGGSCLAQTGGSRSTGCRRDPRSEEHTSELQSRPHLVCRLLLEKKNKNNKNRLLEPAKQINLLIKIKK